MRIIYDVGVQITNLTVQAGNDLMSFLVKCGAFAQPDFACHEDILSGRGEFVGWGVKRPSTKVYNFGEPTQEIRINWSEKEQPDDPTKIIQLLLRRPDVIENAWLTVHTRAYCRIEKGCKPRNVASLLTARP